MQVDRGAAVDLLEQLTCDAGADAFRWPMRSPGTVSAEREARVRDSDVVKAARIISAVARRHMSAGVVAEAFRLLPAGLRELLEPAASEAAAGTSSAAPAAGGER